MGRVVFVALINLVVCLLFLKLVPSMEFVSEHFETKPVIFCILI